MSNPFNEIRMLIDEAEKRVAARLSALKAERDFLKKENEDLWAAEHARQNAEAAQNRRTG